MEDEIAIRLISFALIFILVALWEIRAPRRTLTTSKKWRWFNNIAFIAINLELFRLVFPVLALAKNYELTYAISNDPFWVQ